MLKSKLLALVSGAIVHWQPDGFNRLWGIHIDGFGGTHYELSRHFEDRWRLEIDRGNHYSGKVHLADDIDSFLKLLPKCVVEAILKAGTIEITSRGIMHSIPVDWKPTTYKFSDFGEYQKLDTGGVGKIGSLNTEIIQMLWSLIQKQQDIIEDLSERLAALERKNFVTCDTDSNGDITCDTDSKAYEDGWVTEEEN